MSRYRTLLISQLDPDATAFLNVTGITDPTIKDAVNDLVIDLKGYGIWDKMKAIYPFVGGTPTTHKFNLKDPRDLDVAFRLTFFGGWTHSSNGALPNGANAYADTYSRISADFTPSSVSFSYYSRSNTSAPTTFATEIGVGNGIPNLSYYELDIRRISGNAQINMSDLFTNYINYTNTNSTGYYIANRNGASVLNLWKNNTKVGSNTTASTFNNLPTNNILIAAAKDGASAISNYSNRECALATLGAGLTDTEASNLYLAVQKFQTTLGRNI
jgi:hypothetical protein